MNNDSLYRVSLKCLIKNSGGDILVVKESGRDFWDLPGGGMEHGESILSATARELEEEVGYVDEFTYRVIGLDESVHLASRDIWQARVILEVTPKIMNFSAGTDADEVQFMNPAVFKNSELVQERKIFDYSALT